VGGTLLIAAGGGGDAISASTLSAKLLLTGPPVIMTYSWDRLMIDPLPGPRSAADFADLDYLGPKVAEVGRSTTPIAPAGSSLPRLAAELPARLLLLDPAGGAVDMAAQIRDAATLFSAAEVALVDVGGDILTDGTDPGLRSPLADQLALAACICTGLPARLLIAAPGIDGELPGEVVLARLRGLAAEQLPHFTSQEINPIRHVFRWHPSEASGLLAAAASGHRGLVEVRDAGDQVKLTPETTSLFAVDAKAALDVTPAIRLTASRSLAEAEAIVREVTGISEISYETNKARQLRDRPVHHPTPSDLLLIDAQASKACSRGARYISMRRLSESLGAATLDAFAELCDLLATERPHQYGPSIYRTSMRI
jgi:hypothetical protein